MVRESKQQNIVQIKRQGSRAIRVTLDQDTAAMPIHIISTYAPHSGHSEETRQHHWQEVQELLSKTSKQHLIIWGADANGQLGSRGKVKATTHERQSGQAQSIIGPHTRMENTEKGNGADLQRICRQHQMIPMTTWKRPELNKQDKWKRQPENMDRAQWEEQNREKYLTTWTSPDGKTSRQIDHIMINAKYRNMVRKAQSNIYWHANMNQNQQHRVQTMKLYYNAAKKYKKPIPTETGKNLKYDIKELRENPEKLTKAYQEHEKQNSSHNQQEHDWAEWEIYQGKLGKLLEETYPLKKKDTEIVEPTWKTLMEKWGTDIEKEEINYAYKKRNALQKEIDKGERDLLKQQKSKRQREALVAWKEAADYIRNNKEEIRYSKAPIIDLEARKKPKNTEHITKVSESKR